MVVDAPLIAARRLRVDVPTETGRATAVGPLDLTIARGERLALLGESGCGKSLLALALGWLSPEDVVLEGEVELDGHPLSSLSETALSAVRGGVIGFSVQEPASSINPTYSIGFQLREVVRRHRGLRNPAVRRRIGELLDAVQLQPPRSFLRAFPHQLSGGQLQRATLALALAGDPRLLIADEPTSGLDATVRGEVLELVDRLCRDHGTALLLISHDPDTARPITGRTVVMYAGEVVEDGTTDDVLGRPLHPYTAFLLAPPTDAPPHAPPAPGQWAPGCRFAPRCARAEPSCRDAHPPLQTIDGRLVRCPVVVRAPRAREEP